MSDLVVGGLGGDGPIVTAGLGLTAAPDPDALRATLGGAGTLTGTLTAAAAPDMTADLGGVGTVTATLTDGNAAPAGKPGGRPWGVSLVPPRRPVTVGALSATIDGTSTVTADLDFTIDVDAELEELMLLGIT